MNNNKQDTAALEARCKGVFSPCGYLHVGKDAKYEDSAKSAQRDSYKGKQFQVVGPKTGKTPDIYFGLDNSKKHLYVAEGLPYADTLRFAETQPEKPGKGFLTSDYIRRGEFTDTIRTEQYRSQLKQEERIAKKLQQKHPSNIESDRASFLDAVPKIGFLYDKVFDLSRPGHEAQKLPRDTSNPTMLRRDRHFGPYNTTYLLTHTVPDKDQIVKPEHARRAIVRDTFYEKDMNAHHSTYLSACV